MRTCAITDRGLVRKQNQDSCFTLCDEERDCALLIVCDGMGGAKAGNVASEMAMKVLSDEIQAGLDSALTNRAVCSLMKDALRSANRSVFDLSCSDPACRGMGTTVVAAVLIGEEATVMNVGDSRAYEISPAGIRQVTRDHSVVEDMVRRGDITREQSRTHPNKNLITRAVGTVPDVTADFFSVMVHSGMELLLCSDGLSNVVTESEMLETVRTSADTDSAARALVDLALERGAPDNVTVVIFER